MHPESFFNKQIKKHSALFQALSKKSNFLVLLRFSVFGIIIVTGYLAVDLSLPWLYGVALVEAILFIYLISFHKSVDNQKDFNHFLIELNKEEIKRLYNDHPKEQTGAEFSSKESLFTGDLDVFGKNSLYHHVSRCVLPESKSKLASYLSETNLDHDVAVGRQNIIRSLSIKVEWVQTYLAIIRQSKIDGEERINLKELLENDSSNVKGLRLLTIVLLSISIATIAGFAFDVLPFAALLLLGVLNYAIMVRFVSRIMHLGIKTDFLTKYIHLHVNAMRCIYEQNFNSRELVELSSKINSETLSEIKKLENTLRWLDSRGNFFYGIINAFLVIDLILLQKLVGWIKKNKTEIEEWFDTVYSFEMYCSLASYAFQNNDFVYPVISREKNVLESTNLGHPLIPKEARVYNSFSFGSEKLDLVTGSNMSGKSTFLRTVGINTLMAWSGLPVCASDFVVSDFLIFCSMRTQDNLAENTSSFYAELRRIKLLLVILEKNEIPVMYFLDEILKGTNSQDRHSGAMGIINRLLKADAIGFISTHDLELADEYFEENRVRNISFNSTLSNGELHFDYKIKEGKCVSTNASQLMRNMNIID